MPTVSVVITTWNEEAKIALCIESLAWANEIIVIDSSSTDNTLKIAKKYTKHVYVQPNHSMLNKNKNYGFVKATSDWILSLDADEQITSDLAIEIIAVVKSKNDVNGFWIPRKNIIFGKWIQHGLWWPDQQLRLFRRGKGTFLCQHIHEYITVEGKTGILNEPYIHANYEHISQFLRKMDTLYTENEVAKLQQSGYEVAWYDAIRFPFSDFLKVYFAQQGYLDGLHGLVLSILQSFYSFIVFAKLWEQKGFPEQSISPTSMVKELQRNEKELKYWKTTTLLKEAKFLPQKLLLKVKRKYARTF